VGRASAWAIAGIGAALGIGACSGSSGAGAGGGERIDVKTEFGGIGDTPGKFTYPRAIEADPVTGNLWVIDRSGRVQEIDPTTGRCLTMFKMPRTDLGFPVGLKIAPGRDSHGRWTSRLMYVPDTHNNRVLVIEPPPARDTSAMKPNDPAQIVEPTVVRTIGSYGREGGQFIYPTDVEVLTNADGTAIEKIYVSEYGGNDRVSVFDADFKFVTSFGAFGSSDGGQGEGVVEFNRPQEVRVERMPDGSRRLVILDARNHRLGLFTLEGKLIKWIGSPDEPGVAPGHFLYPLGMVMLEDRSVLVAEFQGCRVQRIDLETGRSLGAWGRAGGGTGELNNAWGLTRVGTRAYVVDARNNRVLGFDVGG
jgi:hypothetical protein